MSNITNCDICNDTHLQDNLINIDPAIYNEAEDLKEQYKDFDGMVCSKCYVDMCK